MKDALLIGMALLVVFSLLSWASAPATVMAERTLRLDAERRTGALQTQVAVLLAPTLTARRCPAYPAC